MHKRCMLAFDNIHYITPGKHLGVFWTGGRYDNTLLVPCFFTGLLGGAVYVNAFTLLSRFAPPSVIGAHCGYILSPLL